MKRVERVELAELALADAYQATGIKQRMIGQFDYAAGTWERERYVIARLEHDARGANPRFVVTSLHGDCEALYEQLYCARGEAENRIKEAQLDLFGRRASCHTQRPHADLQACSCNIRANPFDAKCCYSI